LLIFDELFRKMHVQSKRFWDTVYLTLIREIVINRSVAGKLRNVALTVVTAGIAVLSASAADVWIVALITSYSVDDKLTSRTEWFQMPAN